MDKFFPDLTKKNASELITQIKREKVDGKYAEEDEHSSGITMKFSHIETVINYFKILRG